MNPLDYLFPMGSLKNTPFIKQNINIQKLEDKVTLEIRSEQLDMLQNRYILDTNIPRFIFSFCRISAPRFG